MPGNVLKKAQKKTSHSTGFLWLQPKRKGSLLVEAMMAVVVFGLFMTASYTTLLTGQEGTRNGSMRIRGVNYALQGIEVVRSITSQEGGYSALTPGTHGFTIDPDTGTWVLTGSTLERYGYTTEVEVADLSANTKKVDVTTSWQFGYFRSGQISATTVISNWQQRPGVGDWGVITQTGSYTAGRQRNFTDVYTYKNYTYVSNEGATYGKGLTILNTTNATAPVEVSTAFSLPFNVYSPIAKDNYLYLAVGTVNDVRVYSISDPTSLNGATVAADSESLPGAPARARSLAIAGDTLLVGATSHAGQSELYAYSIATGGTLTLLGSLDITGDPTIVDIYVLDDYAYLAGASANMYIVDISDPTSLAFLNSRQMGFAQATGVRAYGTGFYTTMLNGANEFAMRTGSSGMPSGAVGDLYGKDLTANANSLDIDPLGCYAFIATGNASKEFLVLDAENLTFPEETSYNISNTGEGRAINYDVMRDRVYVATESGVYLYTPATGGRCGDGIGTLGGGGGTYSCPPGYTWSVPLAQCIISGGGSSSSAGSFTVVVSSDDGIEDGGAIAFTPKNTLVAVVVSPGGDDASVTFTASSAVPSNTTVSYSIGGSATNGVDYDTISGTAVISSGNTFVTVPIPINDDNVVENTETILVTITGVSQGTIGSPSSATATIVGDNDTAAISATAHVDLAEPATSGSVTFTLDNSKTTQSALPFTYSIGGTATAGSDYTALSGSATISAGGSSVTVPITVTDDSTIEASETILLTVTSGAGYSVGSDATETVNVTSEDAAATNVIISATSSATEGGAAGSFTIALASGALAPSNVAVTYTVNGASTATSVTDYTALSGSATIPSGSNSVNVTVTSVNDLIVEGTETVIPVLATVPGGYAIGSPSTATVNILDNDSAAISATAHSDLAEPSTNGSVTFSLDSSMSTKNALSFTYSIGGTATAGSDYTALSGSATILAGGTGVVVPITVLDDGTVESTETILLTVTSGAGYSVGSDATETVNVTSEDAAATNVIISATSSATEGGAAGSFTIALASGALAPSNVAVTYTVNGASTATSVTDYTALSGSATIPSGSNSVNVTVTSVNDLIVEGTETVIPVLATVPGGYAIGSPSTATVNILDNDSAAISATASVNLAEPATNGSITFSLDGGMSTKNALTFNISRLGTATVTSDYTGLNTTATILAGGTGVVVPITVVNDLIVEGTETIIPTVTAGAGYSVGATSSRTINITDNDSAAISATTHVNLAEPGTSGSVTFALDGGMTTASAITFSYSRTGTATAGSDYTALSGSATISAAGSSVTVPITIIDDLTVEGTETIITTVTSGAGYSVGSDSAETINITDNDSGGPTGPAAIE